ESRRGIDPNRASFDFHPMPAWDRIFRSGIDGQLGPGFKRTAKQDDDGTTRQLENSMHAPPLTVLSIDGICEFDRLIQRHGLAAQLKNASRSRPGEYTLVGPGTK